MKLLKKRLDLALMDQGLSASREKAQALIMAGKVLVDGRRIDKPGAAVHTDATIVVKNDTANFVSRGGLKLEAALDHIKLDIKGWVCLDVGASTGGFTDCLLQRGAKHVYAVDVGYGQLDWRLRQDSRVTPIERTNIRHLHTDRLPERVDLATIDVSFISLKIVVPAVVAFLKPRAEILALIKPQFEVGKGLVGKGGVVKEAHLRDKVVEDLSHFFRTQGLLCGSIVPSPILGPKGNQESIIHLIRDDFVKKSDVF
jgi:23S rRNA (cytidine1920-2'-O)/16S rRNA (cytidine1409-2'-O)-methyltransferase